MEDTKKHGGQFSSDRQPAKRRGPSRNSKAQLLKAFKKSGIDPTEYWEQLIKTAMADPSSTASSLVAQRLMPPPKSMMPEIQPDLIDERWMELSNSSKLAFIIYLTVSGQISPDQSSAMSRLLTESAQLQVDKLDQYHDVQLAKSEGSRDKQKLYEKLDRLEETIRQRTIDDVQALKSLILAEDESGDASGTDAPTTADDQDDSSEPLVSVSLKDVVKSSENNTNNTNEETTDE